VIHPIIPLVLLTSTKGCRIIPLTHSAFFLYMKTEKILLSFVAIIIGLIVAGIGFYLYQSTKAISPTKLGTVKIVPPTPTPPSVYLTIDTPQNESTTSNKTVAITGRTNSNATVVVSTFTADQVIVPTSEGNFSTTVLIGNGENEIHVTSISPSGTQAEKIVTLTYTTENF